MSQARVRTDDRQATAGASYALPRPMEHGEEIRLGRPPLAEIDDEQPVPEAQREIHAANNSHSSTGLRTADEHCRMVPLRTLLADLDHRTGVPAASRVQTASRPGTPLLCPRVGPS